MSKLIKNIGTFIASFAVSFVAVGVVFPLIATVITVAIDLIPPEETHRQTLLYGGISTGILWLLCALFCIHFCTARGANIRSYHLLRNRLHQLGARLGIDASQSPPDENTRMALVGMLPTDCICNRIALRETYAYYNAIKEALEGPPSRASLQWVLGTGYISVWNIVHRADEAILQVEPRELVIHAAIHDKLSIQDSNINGHDELLDKLIQAIKDIDPAAMAYFSEHQPCKDFDGKLQKMAHYYDENLNKLVQIVSQFDPSFKLTFIGQQLIEGNTDTSTTRGTSDSTIEARARVALRSVRRALNEFRDNRWEGLIRARIRLLGAIALTGLITYVLLAIAILSNAPLEIIAAATAFYVVGAIAGLFGRLYEEAGNNSAVDDYGLAATRLIATPMLSGLAGIGAAFISVLIAIAANSSGQPPKVALSDIFRLEPRFLFAAVVFGLTPNLLIRSLEQQTKRYASDIQSVQESEQGSRSK